MKNLSTNKLNKLTSNANFNAVDLNKVLTANSINIYKPIRLNKVVIKNTFIDNDLNNEVKDIYNTSLVAQKNNKLSQSKTKQVNKLVNLLIKKNTDKLTENEIVIFKTSLNRFKQVSLNKLYKIFKYEHRDKELLIIDLIGEKTTFPTFKQFNDKVQSIERFNNKGFYSYFDLLRVLKTFNKVETVKKKVKKQNDKLTKV